MRKDSLTALFDLLMPPAYDPFVGGLASEVIKTKEAYLWRFELPGFDASQVEVSVLEKELLLKVKATKSVDTKSPTWFQSELSVVEESLLLSQDVDLQKVSSEMKNGVLTVTMPRVQAQVAKELPRKVEVKS